MQISVLLGFPDLWMRAMPDLYPMIVCRLCLPNFRFMAGKEAFCREKVKKFGNILIFLRKALFNLKILLYNRIGKFYPRTVCSGAGDQRAEGCRGYRFRYPSIQKGLRS